MEVAWDGAHLWEAARRTEPALDVLAYHHDHPHSSACAHEVASGSLSGNHGMVNVRDVAASDRPHNMSPVHGRVASGPEKPESVGAQVRAVVYPVCPEVHLEDNATQIATFHCT